MLPATVIVFARARPVVASAVKSYDALPPTPVPGAYTSVGSTPRRTSYATAPFKTSHRRDLHIGLHLRMVARARRRGAARAQNLAPVPRVAGRRRRLPRSHGAQIRRRGGAAHQRPAQVRDLSGELAGKNV